MPVFGEIKAFVDLLGNWRRARGDRADPAHAQAHRVIDSFEAHGIARQQVTRLLPPSIAIPTAAFSTPDKLKTHITPALLDWASELLALDRAWLDRVEPHPHKLFDAYKDESTYAKWFAQRQASEPTVQRSIYVWSHVVPTPTGRPHGPLCIVYCEDLDGLDGKTLSRYLRLSHAWPLDHAPAVISMLKLVAAAQAQGILVTGRVVPLAILRAFEAGRMFAPQVSEQSRTLWHPDDLNVEAIGF